VLFRFHEVIDDDSRMHALDLINSMSKFPGILEWRVEASMDLRKGVVAVQNVLFESQEVFDAYRAHPTHADVGLALSGMSNWLVADYVEAPA
jgi:hypothetical protein